MGYSKSKRAIKRVESYLQQMLSAEGEIQFPAEDPGKFAYYLREGITVSKLFALDHEKQPVQPYADYSRLAAKYIVRVKGPVVVCEPRDVVPQVRLRDLGQTVIPDVGDTLGIIGAAITHRAPTMVFTDASSEGVDIPKLFAWSQQNEYFLVVAESHVTLTRTDPGELAWKP